MPGIVRNRSKTIPEPSVGSYTIGGTIHGTRGLAPSLWTCVDTIGAPKSENPFTLVKKNRLSDTRMSGLPPNVALRSVPSGYDAGKVGATSVPLNLRSGTFRDPTQGIASAHPGDPIMELPNFIFELKDVPRMLRHASDRAKLLTDKGAATPRLLKEYLSSPRATGEDHLNYVFGWKPLVSDLVSLLDVQKFLDNRLRRLKSLERTGFITTRTDLGEISGRMSQQVQMNSDLSASFSGHEYNSYTSRRWAVAHWKTTNIQVFRQPLLDMSSLIDQALGLDFRVSQLWNAIPWTFLIDWFANVDSLISLRQNRCGVVFHNASVMTETIETTKTIPGKPPSGVILTGFSEYETVTKNRFSFQPGFLRSDYSVNVLPSSKLNIIASLAVTRGKR